MASDLIVYFMSGTFSHFHYCMYNEKKWKKIKPFSFCFANEKSGSGDGKGTGCMNKYNKKKV